jgi:hypothetical protein
MPSPKYHACPRPCCKGIGKTSSENRRPAISTSRRACRWCHAYDREMKVRRAAGIMAIQQYQAEKRKREGRTGRGTYAEAMREARAEFNTAWAADRETHPKSRRAASRRKAA